MKNERGSERNRLISTVDFPPLSAKFAAYQIRSKAVIPYVLMERNKIPEAAMRQLALESNLDMLEKQVRMLVKLAERSPVVKGKLTDEIVKALEPGTEYVIVERQSMNELLEGMELWAYLVKNQLFGKKNRRCDFRVGWVLNEFEHGCCNIAIALIEVLSEIA